MTSCLAMALLPLLSSPQPPCLLRKSFYYSYYNYYYLGKELGAGGLLLPSSNRRSPVMGLPLRGEAAMVKVSSWSS